ncbi:diaminopimelate epimerase [Lactobacillus sp. ESL0701]|uniref:diaminopimelate epimerase n=1 Tax=Lactobacillus sp. ESL0701 TaxID=2983217 RepID=UPI0023F770EC|nr:diaminopimelate epimerase [Lactobacillus sp. ESL0701]MDF7671901.1 diaminopimelate epimerase [Lactobacillus sp. ESL0701]
MINIEKVHGSQNSFFLLDQTKLVKPLTTTELQNLVIKLTDSKTGLLGGSDGLLVVEPATAPAAIAQMRIFNKDGSQALMCGNGLRTVARYLAGKLHQREFLVQTAAANLRVQQYPDLAPGVPAFSVEIAPVSFTANDVGWHNLPFTKIINQPIPAFSANLKFTALAVPNPHLISFVADIHESHEILGQLGQELNQPNQYFPGGVNVSFAQILAPNKLFVETYERGVGFTNACGTGMSATSLAGHLAYPEQIAADELLTVYNLGGLVKTKIHSRVNGYWIELIGNATVTHQIYLPEKCLHEAEFEQQQVSLVETDEQDAYLKFVSTFKNS